MSSNAKAFYVPPQAPKPEPVLVLRYGDMEAEITYTGLHHLLNCGGWGDGHRDNLYFSEDAALQKWLSEVRRRMGDSTSLFTSGERK